MLRQIEIGKRYRIVLAHPLFADWVGVIADCKNQVNGLYEMHANNAFIYCDRSHLRSVR